MALQPACDRGQSVLPQNGLAVHDDPGKSATDAPLLLFLIVVCGELLNLGKTVICHTQVKKVAPEPNPTI